MEQEQPLIKNETEDEWVFRRPEPKDEIDRIGNSLVRRMMEAGVIESQ